MILNIVIAVVALVIGGLAGYCIFRYVVTGKYNQMIGAAEKEADVLKEKKMLEVKEKFLNKKSELEKEVQSRNQKIQQSENRLKQREISLNQRQEELGRKKQELDQQQQRVENEKKLLQIKQEELDKMQLQEREKLEELSGLSAEEAKNRLVESLKDEARTDAASYVNEIMPRTNMLKVGDKSECFRSHIRIGDMNFIRPLSMVDTSLEYTAKTRGKDKEHAMRFAGLDSEHADIVFSEPVFAPVSVQDVVVYDNSRCLVLGGTIV